MTGTGVTMAGGDCAKVHPEPLPERLIGGDPGFFLRSHFNHQWAPPDATEKMAVARYCAALRHVRNLRAFWSGKRVRDYEAGRKAYLATRASPRTANTELGALSAFTNAFKDSRGLVGKINFRVEEPPPAPVRWLGHDEIAALLRSARARHGSMLSHLPPRAARLAWDEERGRWLPRRGPVSAATGPASAGPRSQADWIGRLILILTYTGSTARCAFRLRWDGDLDCGWSYVDLDTEIEGHIYRLGPDLASANMAGVPVALSRRLAAHLRRWREADRARGFTHVLHRSPYVQKCAHLPPDREASNDLVAIRKVWSTSGVEGGLDLGKLSCTAVVWVLRSGMRTHSGVEPFQPSRAIMRSAAFMIGRRYDDFIERFRSVAPDFNRKQIEALQTPAGTVR